MIPTNIQLGFSVTGIYNHDKNIFTEDEFHFSDSTDCSLDKGFFCCNRMCNLFHRSFSSDTGLLTEVIIHILKLTHVKNKVRENMWESS